MVLQCCALPAHHWVHPLILAGFIALVVDVFLCSSATFHVVEQRSINSSPLIYLCGVCIHGGVFYLCNELIERGFRSGWYHRDDVTFSWMQNANNAAWLWSRLMCFKLVAYIYLGCRSFSYSRQRYRMKTDNRGLIYTVLKKNASCDYIKKLNTWEM